MKRFLKLFEQKPPPKEAKRLAFKDVRKWLKNEGAELRAEEASLHASIRDRAQEMLSELDEGLAALENVDYESQQVEPRTKAIVRGNLQKYLTQIALLKESIRSLDEEGLGTYTVAMRSLLDEMFKKTHVNRQKASLLLGNELAVVHKSITDYAKFFKKTLESNEEIIDTSNTLTAVEQQLSNIDEIEESIEEIEKTITALKKKREKETERMAKLGEEIDTIKQSDKYAEQVRKADEARENKKALEKALLQLRSSIDFKALGNEFHSDPKRMRVVRAHKENFKESFGDGSALLELLTEARIDRSESIEHIRRLQKASVIHDEDETQALRSEQESLSSQVATLKEEISTETKRQAKLRTRQRELKDSIIQELAKIDVHVRP